MTLINTPLSEDKKYAIADSIARNCAQLDPEVVEANSKFYFREIINSQIKVNNKVVKLCDAFLTDDATHITNLVIKRISIPKLFKVNPLLSVTVADSDAKEETTFDEPQA